MVTKLRHSLHDQSVRAGKLTFHNTYWILLIYALFIIGTLLGAWSRSSLPGIVNKEELVNRIVNKSKRPNNTRGGRPLQREDAVGDISRA